MPDRRIFSPLGAMVFVLIPVALTWWVGGFEAHVVMAVATVALDAYMGLPVRR